MLIPIYPVKSEQLSHPKYLGKSLHRIRGTGASKRYVRAFIVLGSVDEPNDPRMLRVGVNSKSSVI